MAHVLEYDEPIYDLHPPNTLKFDEEVIRKYNQLINIFLLKR